MLVELLNKIYIVILYYISSVSNQRIHNINYDIINYFHLFILSFREWKILQRPKIRESRGFFHFRTKHRGKHHKPCRLQRYQRQRRQDPWTQHSRSFSCPY